jgi:quinol monooxygenase YgiN
MSSRFFLWHRTCSLCSHNGARSNARGNNALASMERDAMVNLMLRMVTSPGMGDGVAEGLNTVVGPGRSIPGCISFRIYSDKDDPDVVLLMSQWRSEDHLNKYIRMPDFRRILTMMETASKAPDLSVQHISWTKGLDYVREVLEANID